MAWPSTPLTSYVAGVTPYIKAFDLNALQGGVNGIVNGTYSLHSLTLDGTGGAVVAGSPGTARLSATASGTATPTAAVPWGTMTKESALFGDAAVDSAGGFISGFNVLSCSRLGVGQYRVTFNGAPTNVARCTGQVTGRFNAAARICELNSLSLAGADLQADILIYDTAGAAADARFDLHVFGG